MREARGGEEARQTKPPRLVSLCASHAQRFSPQVATAHFNRLHAAYEVLRFVPAPLVTLVLPFEAHAAPLTRATLTRTPSAARRRGGRCTTCTATRACVLGWSWARR